MILLKQMRRRLRSMVDMKNKRGQLTIMIVFFIFFAFGLILFSGIKLFIVKEFQNLLSGIEFQIGNVSFNQTYNQTLAPALDTFVRSSDQAGVFLIFGMIVIMLLIGFLSQKNNRMWIAADIFIVVISFILAVYLSRTFDAFINSSSAFLNIYSVDLERSSTLILNLPYLIPIAGILIMIATYGIRTKRREPNVF